MAAAEFSLKDLALNLNNSLGRPLGEFKQAATDNHKNLSKIVKDISGMFSAQRKDIAGLTEAVQESVDASNQAANKSDTTNALLQDSISIQSTIASEMKNMVAFTKNLNTLMYQISSGSNNSSIFGSILSKLGDIAVPIGKLALGVTAAGVAGAGGAMLYNQMSGEQSSGAGGQYDAAATASLIRKAGGTEEEAKLLGAIAQPESGGNPRAHNTNTATGDDSYGLWQINMLGKMGPERLKKFNLRSPEDLYDPQTNARVALQMYRERGNAEDWSAYKAGRHQKYLSAAAKGASGSTVSDATTPQSQTSTTTPSTSETPKDASKVSAPSPTETGKQESAHQENNKPVEGNSNAKQFLQSRESAGGGDSVGVNSGKLDDNFASKMAAAIQAAEKATGTKVRITEGYRDPHVQAQYYSDYIGKPITYDGKTYQPNPAKLGRLAAPPGRSNHQKGMAIDMADSPAREWIRAHASEFGLRHLGGKDMPHFEMAGASAISSTTSSSFSVGGEGATPSTGGGGETTAGAQTSMVPAALQPFFNKMKSAASYMEGFGGGEGMSMTQGVGGAIGAAAGGLMTGSLTGALGGAALGGLMGTSEFTEPFLKTPTPYIGEAPPPAAEIVPGTAESVAGDTLNRAQIENLAIDQQTREKMLELLSRKEKSDQETLERQHYDGAPGSWDYNNPNDIEWPDWASMIGGNHWEEMKKIKKNMW